MGMIQYIALMRVGMAEGVCALSTFAVIQWTRIKPLRFTFKQLKPFIIIWTLYLTSFKLTKLLPWQPLGQTHPFQQDESFAYAMRKGYYKFILKMEENKLND